jgi:surfeit locus 1 family protein
LSRRGLLVPAASAALMVLVLLGLGTWQVQRLAWKRGILAQLDAAERLAPVPLGTDPSPFAKVAATGKLRPDLAVRYGAEVQDLAAGAIPGAQLVVPLERPGAPPLLIDLGWVPDHGAPPALPTGDSVTIVGFVHPPAHPGWFAAADDVAGRRFFTLDPAAIGAALGLSAVAPFTLVALGPPPAATDAPIPAGHLPQPPNNHLQYALTWYGLAAALVVVFVTYIRKVPRA